MTPETGKCSICGERYTNYGNNPQPVIDDINARCCNQCNVHVVMIVRLRKISQETTRLIRSLQPNVTCTKCHKVAIMIDVHTLPKGWERSGMGDDFCDECMQEVYDALDRLRESNGIDAEDQQVVDELNEIIDDMEDAVNQRMKGNE